MLRIVASVLFVGLLCGGFDAARAAPCTVPNTLTNGQPADATKVMADFNSVTTCINSAPAGSTGALQYNAGSGAFGGVGPLTNGQLVVGSTGANPQAATLTAGSGINITNGAGAITIATTAASSAGLYNISVGIPAAYTPINIGSNSAVVTNGTKALTVRTGTSTPTTPTLYGVTVPVPGTTPYMVAILALQNANPVKFSGPAFGFYDSTTG